MNQASATLTNLPEVVTGFLKRIHDAHQTAVVVREFLPAGKSGAFVAIVDCDGRYNGIYVLKVDAVSSSRKDEQTRHKQALENGAFSGKVPAIVLAERTDHHYCLLIKLAGESRIAWRPLLAALRLFRSAYSKLATITWTPSLFLLGTQAPASTIASDAIGYKLVVSNGGRIRKHLSEYIGKDFLDRPQFLHHDELLPNPFTFVNSNQPTPIIRPLLGPVHGDCHAQNVFVKADSSASIADICLIDLATYQPKSLYFFDHAYLELATMLQAMTQLGDRRWLQLVLSLSRSTTNSGDDADRAELEQHERSWFDDIHASRIHAFQLAYDVYPDRMDDLRLQFLLAQVAAGLAFLHKVPRQDSGSGGLTRLQYQQCFVSAAVNLRQLFEALGVSANQLFRGESNIPVLGPPTPTEGNIPNDKDWQSVSYFDPQGFNILVISKITEELPPTLMSLAWSLIIDFRESAPPDSDYRSQDRPFRQYWPGAPIPDTKLLRRGGIWYFADGRADISGLAPSNTTAEWRRQYRRPLDDLLLRVSETVSPLHVRTFFLTDGFSYDQIRLIAESLDTAFHSGLAPLVVAGRRPSIQAVDGFTVIPSSLEAALIALCGKRAAAQVTDDAIFLPTRRSGQVTLEVIPPDTLRRVGRDLTVVARSLARAFPGERTFGVDFRRGMPIEWAELAQNLDVPRAEHFAHYRKLLDAALAASSNHTVNLLHEPSAGGTTLSRRLAWEFMEQYPTVCLDQLSADTSSYLRDLFRISSLPILVVMEASVITESEREGLVRQLREDNTRAVFLWVSRFYGANQREEILPTTLNDDEASQFLEIYLEQVTEGARRGALQLLAASKNDLRSPFFFGLTAFGEEFLGVDRLVHDVVASASNPGSRSLVADLCLVSLYSNDGFPLAEFEELCGRFNGGEWPLEPSSLFLLCTPTHVRVSHAILASKALAAMARRNGQWRADLPLLSNTLIEHLASLSHKVSNRIQVLVSTLFITRDIESALEADTDVQIGGIGSTRRFSPLINDIGNAIQARTILRRIASGWPKEPHFAAHLARHLLYEDPKGIAEAVEIATRAEQMSDWTVDASLIHVAGMAFRVRMGERLQGALQTSEGLNSIEELVRADFLSATERFAKSTTLNPSNEHGLVATIQTVSLLLKLSAKIAGATDLGDFLRRNTGEWYLEALALGEDSIEALRNRPSPSARAGKAIADWGLVFGRIEKVVADLRMLASRHEDPSIRRALCAAIIERAKHRWNAIPQGDLRTIAGMMERNILRQGVRDSDIRRWFSAYRRLDAFNLDFAIERLIDWHKLNSTAVEPAFYLYTLNFLRWLTAPSPREGLAMQVVDWLKVCQSNRPLGARNWSYEWLERDGNNSYRIVHFLDDPDFDPPSIIRAADHPQRKKLEARLMRIDGVMRNYRGPQVASLDFGQGITARITPLDKLTKDDEGRRIAAYLSFSYDGLVGWDPVLLR